MVKTFASFALSAALVLTFGCENGGNTETESEGNGNVTYSELEGSQPLSEPTVDQTDQGSTGSEETVVGDATLEDLAPESSGGENAAEPQASGGDAVEEVPTGSGQGGE